MGGGLGSPTGGLNNRIEGIFLCIMAQFPVKSSPTETKFFPDGGTAPSPPLAPPLKLYAFRLIRDLLVAKIV